MSLSYVKIIIIYIFICTSSINIIYSDAASGSIPITTTTTGGGYQVGSPWPHFRGPFNNNSGQGFAQGPLSSSSLMWIFHTNTINSGNYISTPAIANDGTIYVGANNTFNAISYSGSLIWKYSAKYFFESSP